MIDLREKTRKRVTGSVKRNVVIEAGTGIGKTKMALDRLSLIHKKGGRALIVVPKLVLIDGWKDEFGKWGYGGMLEDVEFTTYISLRNHAGMWETIIFDEAHHLSERSRACLVDHTVAAKYTIWLSATLGYDVRNFLYWTYRGDMEVVRVSTRDAIDSGALPDPEIILVPLSLRSLTATQLYIPKKQWKDHGDKLWKAEYKDRWKAKKAGRPYALLCTERQYYDELSSLIDWLSERMDDPVKKRLYLNKCGERLKWLASLKEGYVRMLCDELGKKKERFIVFCNSIEQSEKFGVKAINSSVGTDALDGFNDHKIDGISCVGMVDEGVNLADCRVGVFGMINSSGRLQVQRVGRLLRHDDPVIMIPFYKDTREQEIVRNWMKNLDSDRVVVVEGIRGAVSRL